MEETAEKDKKIVRSKLLTAGAVLTITGGVIGVIIAIAAAACAEAGKPLVFPTLVFTPGWEGAVTEFTFAAVAMVAVIGGIDALKRRNFRLALAGAIYALFCTGIPGLFGITHRADLAGSPWAFLPLLGAIGILAVIFVSVKHAEFTSRFVE